MRVETGHSIHKLTYADLERLPEDDLRHEIIGGEHFVIPSPVTKHQRISGDMVYALTTYVKKTECGFVFYAPYDIVLSTFDVVVPDIVYVSNDRLARYLTAKNLQGPPDLVVEILSPGTKRRDQMLKRDLYERVGVLEYWLVDPDGEDVTVHRRGGSVFEAPQVVSRDDSLSTTLLPGLDILLQPIFRSWSG